MISSDLAEGMRFRVLTLDGMTMDDLEFTIDMPLFWWRDDNTVIDPEKPLTDDNVKTGQRHVENWVCTTYAKGMDPQQGTVGTAELIEALDVGTTVRVFEGGEHS